MQRDRARRASLDLAHDAVAVLLAVGQRQQDFEGDRGERKKRFAAGSVHRCLESIRSEAHRRSRSTRKGWRTVARHRGVDGC